MRHPTHLFEMAFNRLGSQIGKHPKLIIAGGVLFALLSSIGLLRFEEENNVRTEYSPLNAPSKKEYQVAKQFLKQNGTLDPCYIMSRAHDGGNLLRDDYRWLLYNLTKSLQQEVRVISGGRVFGYRDLCEPYCEMNTAFLAFLKVYDPTQPLTHTYPAMEMFGTRAFIGNNVYGVTLKNLSVDLSSIGADRAGENSSTTTEEERALLMALSVAEEGKKAHRQQQKNIKLLEAFTTAVMPFYLVSDYKDTELLNKWQKAAVELFERPQYSRLFKTGMTGDNMVTAEVRRMGVETAPLLVGSVVAMIVFVLFTLIRVRKTENRLWEAFVGCLSSSIGLMSIAGWRFQSIIVAALFLVLSVGVDDIFILMRAWQRSNELYLIPERMAQCLEDAGPSITISSLTNVISFIIGAFSDTPAVRTFCIFSAIAISICWLYQLVFLSAVLVFSEGRRQKTVAKGILKGPKSDGQEYCAMASHGERLQRMIVEFWAWAVTKWFTRFVLTLFMSVYFFISWQGIQILQSNISIDKMALPNSYLHQFQLQFETALRNMQPISVFVLRPGDLRDPQQLARVKQLVWDFEHALNSYGAESTFFWLPQYEDFVRFYSSGNENEDEGEADPTEDRPPPFDYTEMPAFFRSASYFYLSSFVHHNESACLANQPECISSFFFVTNFHRVIKYHELVPTVREWRRIAQHYADMEVFAYSDHTPFVDQTMSIDQTVLGSVAAALLCTCMVCLVFIPHFLSVVAAVFSTMSIDQTVLGSVAAALLCTCMVCLVFIPHFLSVVAAVFSVFSISCGIFGFLALWGVDLGSLLKCPLALQITASDPLSMAALLMAIGFSVDFTSHISYHYYKAPDGNAQVRMQHTLTVIGWPMVQVGLSTIVALLPLLLKQSYLAMTIVVVVCLGMFHGLVILPAVLTALPSTEDSKSSSTSSSSHSSAHRRESSQSAKSSSGSSAASSDGGIGSEESSTSTSNTSLEGDSQSERRRKATADGSTEADKRKMANQNGTAGSVLFRMKPFDRKREVPREENVNQNASNGILWTELFRWSVNGSPKHRRR
uniref:SSD domain-containing protein n=1 Tax=Globodera pallida TaxID=36090 RepID=A0A183C9J7_GLOPA